MLLQDLELFKDYWVVSEREQGLTRIRVVSWDGAEDYICFDGETYSAGIGFNPAFDTTELRYSSILCVPQQRYMPLIWPHNNTNSSNKPFRRIFR